MLVSTLFFSQSKIARLEKENQALQIENTAYRERCADMKIKLQAQANLASKVLEREQEILSQEYERKKILKEAKQVRQSNTEEIIDNETRKKVIHRLNRPL